jgi:DNA-binding transcriptional regulator LsrR (DeoR family)
MAENREDFEAIRQIYTVLVLHFVDDMKQSDIALALNLSPSKVNRLIAQGRKLGMVKIAIESPFQPLVDLETRLTKAGGLTASVLLETLRDGDVIAITGGKAVSAVVENLSPERAFDVTVVPLTGGVQGKFYTDVNHLASRLAERLGGRTLLMHAPLFAESREQRDMLMDMASVREVFDLARKAAVALVGIGSIVTAGSSYYDLNPLTNTSRELLIESGVRGEFLAHLIREDGSVADHPLNSRLVALEPSDLSRCPRTIGVAAGPEKVLPIRAALNGRFLDALVVDEETAGAVLEAMEPLQNVA